VHTSSGGVEMMADSYTPSLSTSLMFDIPKCSGCGGPKTVNRILQDWGANHNWTRGRYEVLVNCTSQRCSWNDCMIQLTLDEVGFVPQPKVVAPKKKSVSIMDWTAPVATDDKPPTRTGGIMSLLGA
tara:strand:+ start:673 stop:1053 length:381 start_codon:yes stop_codon:yes gene_type:complete